MSIQRQKTMTAMAVGIAAILSPLSLSSGLTVSAMAQTQTAQPQYRKETYSYATGSVAETTGIVLAQNGTTQSKDGLVVIYKKGESGYAEAYQRFQAMWNRAQNAFAKQKNHPLMQDDIRKASQRGGHLSVKQMGTSYAVAISYDGIRTTWYTDRAF